MGRGKLKKLLVSQAPYQDIDIPNLCNTEEKKKSAARKLAIKPVIANLGIRQIEPAADRATKKVVDIKVESSSLPLYTKYRESISARRPFGSCKERISRQ